MRRYVALVAILCALVGNAHAADALRVLYAEPFLPQVEGPGTTTQQKMRAANRLRLQAFGRGFDLELADNGALLRASALSPTDRSSVAMFKGTVVDAPGSWVRLTLIDGRYEGAFWDGADLYAIGARNVVEPTLQSPLGGASSASVIYRLSDTQGGLLEGVCGTTADSSARTGLARYRDLVRELTGAVAAKLTATREVSIALVADYEFVSRTGGNNVIASLINRANVLDGIFSDQVGISIVPTEFITYAADTDSFSSSVPITLLNQFADFKQSRGDLASRALAHLVTGRQLEGSTIGIGFLGSVCRPREAASLSEASPFIDSVLIMAHEVGHNLGAGHDGEAGSPCPLGYLMSPSFNSNATLSSCSVQSIRTTIDGADCVVPIRARDVEITVPSESVAAVINRPFELQADVRALTEAGAANVSVTASLGSFTVQSASLDGEACAISSGQVTCFIPQLAFGTTRRLTVRVSPSFAGIAYARFDVSALNDSNAANNMRQVRVNVASEREVTVAFNPTPIVSVVGEPFDMTIDVTSVGALALTDVQASIVMSQKQVVSASVEGGAPCSVSNAGSSSVVCPLGRIESGAMRRIALRVISTAPGTSGHTILLEDRGASRPALTTKYFNIETVAARDLATSFEPITRRIAVGVESDWAATVKSNGVYPVANARLRLTPGPQLTQVFRQFPASCTAAGEAIECELGTIAAGATVTLPFRLRVDQLVQGSWIGAQLLQSDDVAWNDSVAGGLDVVPSTEIRISGSFATQAYDLTAARLTAFISSTGLNDVVGATAGINFPQGFRIVRAKVGPTQCVVDAASENEATCALHPIVFQASNQLEVDYIAPLPGTFAVDLFVAASGDADATNNDAHPTVVVKPYVDGRLSMMPAPLFRLADAPFDLAFTVVTNRHVMPDATLLFGWTGSLSEVSVMWAGGSCSSTRSPMQCELGDLPADATVPVTVRVTPLRETASVTMYANLQSPAEVQFGDNSQHMNTSLYVPTDFGVAVTQTEANGVVGTVLDIAGITVSTVDPLYWAYIEIDADPALLSDFQITNIYCEGSSVPRRCDLSVHPNSPARVGLRMKPVVAGPVPIRIRVGAFNDSTAQNNEATITLNVQAAPAPPSPPSQPSTPSGGGGGGGGGAIEWHLLAMLLFVLRLRAVRARQ